MSAVVVVAIIQKIQKKITFKKARVVKSEILFFIFLASDSAEM